MTRLWNPSAGEPPSHSAISLAQFGPRSVIDVGCGDGRNLVPFIESADLLIGVDSSPNALMTAASRLSAVAPAHLVAMRLPQVTFARRFEVVMCHGVIHFLTRADRLAALEALKRLPEPGGLLSIVAFNARQPIPDDLADVIPDPAVDSDELLDVFADWETIRWSTYDYEDEHDAGRIRHVHSIDRLIVRAG